MPTTIGEAGLASGQADGVDDASRRRRQHCSALGMAWRQTKWSRVRVTRPHVQLWCPGGKPGAVSVETGAGWAPGRRRRTVAMRESEWRERDRDEGVFMNIEKCRDPTVN